MQDANFYQITFLLSSFCINNVSLFFFPQMFLREKSATDQSKEL